MRRTSIQPMIGISILAISAIWWMPYYPIWSLTYITIGLFLIYALAAYGGRTAVDERAR